MEALGPGRQWGSQVIPEPLVSHRHFTQGLLMSPEFEVPVALLQLQYGLAHV